MSEEKYVWAWTDEDSTYVNKADTLEEIIQEIIEHYEPEAKEITIEEKDGKFVVRYLSEYVNDWEKMEDMDFGGIEEELEDCFKIHCEFEYAPWATARFLGTLARVYEREDHFDIKKNN
ncbi:hypothetical protein [Burkholderia multivorans]|uniref:hypothetical protein n=1 Tax=Burkholderia multivorans TaxID=87883 RepID=UPI0011B1E9CC|nr:hypothetical protein [Burkholderia multivorans]